MCLPIRIGGQVMDSCCLICLHNKIGVVDNGSRLGGWLECMWGIEHKTNATFRTTTKWFFIL